MQGVQCIMNIPFKARQSSFISPSCRIQHFVRYEADAMSAASDHSPYLHFFTKAVFIACARLSASAHAEFWKAVVEQ